MRKSIVIGSVIALAASATGIGIGMAAGGGGGDGRLGNTFSAWGHDFTYDSFAPKQLDVTVATEKKTGHKMNLVKLRNGHMMALVPADRYMGLMTTPVDDLFAPAGP